jgi:hypothetical protein
MKMGFPEQKILPVAIRIQKTNNDAMKILS